MLAIYYSVSELPAGYTPIIAFILLLLPAGRHISNKPSASLPTSPLLEYYAGVMRAVSSLKGDAYYAPPARRAV